jgi:lipoyl(octanoyl) transferase
VEVFECDRGGDVTFHGPGQLVGYPILDLREHAGSQLPVLGSQEKPIRKHLGAVDYVRRLEEVLIHTCADFGIRTKRVTGLTGVWTDNVAPGLRPGLDGSETRPYITANDDVSDGAKIAAIGVHISRFVTSHGFALNVNTDLSFFDLIVPCGITSKPVASMKKELGHEVEMNAVSKSIARNFAVVFATELSWVATVDALLAHSVGVPLRVPEELRNLHGEDASFVV